VCVWARARMRLLPLQLAALRPRVRWGGLAQFSSQQQDEVAAKIQKRRHRLSAKEIQALEELAALHRDEFEQVERKVEERNPRTGEMGGPQGPEPTRYGDWERNGRVSDF